MRLGASLKTIFVTYSCGSCVLDNSILVAGLQEHLVELVDEVNVSDKTTSRAGLVPLDQLACLLFGKIYSKGANTGAELREKRMIELALVVV